VAKQAHNLTLKELLSKTSNAQDEETSGAYAVTGLGRSIRKTCLLVGLPRASYDYKPVAGHDDELLRERIRAGPSAATLRLAADSYLTTKGKVGGQSQAHREDIPGKGLCLRKRRRKKAAAKIRVPLAAPERPNERWSIDFTTDSLVIGRRFRALVIVDDYFRECPAIEVDTSPWEESE
jgi:putative transposase